MTELIPIITPLNWTADQDLEYYEERWGETNDYAKSALWRVTASYAELQDAVDKALSYFVRKDQRLEPVHPGTLTLAEKLQRLSVLTSNQGNDYDYKGRFAQHIQACEWADAERQRVMMTYYAGGEGTWLRPLCELADLLASAAYSLDEGMKCEHPDYDGAGHGGQRE